MVERQAYPPVLILPICARSSTAEREAYTFVVLGSNPSGHTVKTKSDRYLGGFQVRVLACPILVN